MSGFASTKRKQNNDVNSQDSQVTKCSRISLNSIDSITSLQSVDSVFSNLADLLQEGIQFVPNKYPKMINTAEKDKTLHGNREESLKSMHDSFFRYLPDLKEEEQYLITQENDLRAYSFEQEKNSEADWPGINREKLDIDKKFDALSITLWTVEENIIKKLKENQDLLNVVFTDDNGNSLTLLEAAIKLDLNHLLRVLIDEYYNPRRDGPSILISAEEKTKLQAELAKIIAIHKANGLNDKPKFLQFYLDQLIAKAPSTEIPPPENYSVAIPECKISFQSQSQSQTFSDLGDSQSQTFSDLGDSQSQPQSQEKPDNPYFGVKQRLDVYAESLDTTNEDPLTPIGHGGGKKSKTKRCKSKRKSKKSKRKTKRTK
jgi:hypothetical protein